MSTNPTPPTGAPPSPQPAQPLGRPVSELLRFPTIILIAPRQFGKTETLARWRAMLPMIEVERDGESATYTTSSSLPAARHDATVKLTEWLLALPGRTTMRIIDVPGEMVIGRRGPPVRGQADDTRRFREDLRRMVVGGLVIGVVMCLRPAVSLSGHQPGRVHAQIDRYQQILGGLKPGREEVIASLHDINEFLETYLGQFGHPPSGLHLALQFGFADLISFGVDERSDQRTREELIAAYRDLKTQLDGRARALARPSEDQQEALERVDEISRQVFGEFVSEAEAMFGRSLFVYAQSSVEHGVLRFPPHHQITGLAWIVGQHLGALDEEEERGARAAQQRNKLLLALLILAGFGLAFALAWANPSWLGPLSSVACGRLSAWGTGRCECVEPLAASATDEEPLAARARALLPHMNACRAEPGREGAVAGTLVSLELASALLAPDAFCSGALSDERWSTASDASIGPPLLSGAEREFGRWLLHGLQGEVAPSEQVASGLEAQGGFDLAVAALRKNEDASSCLDAWSAARRGAGPWLSAHLACRQADAWAALGSDLQTRFAADSPPLRRAPREKLEPLPAVVGAPATRGRCDSGLTLDMLAGAAPAVDGLVAANLAAMANTGQASQAWAEHARGLPTGVRVWLRLSDPGVGRDDRRSEAAALAESEVSALSAVFSGPWVEASSGTAHNRPSRSEERMLRLRTEHVTDIACGLLPSRIDTASLFTLAAPGDPADARADLAGTLLELEPDAMLRRGVEWERCRTMVEVRSLRYAEPSRRVSAAKRAMSSLQRVAEAGEADRSNAAALACDVAAETLPAAEVLDAYYYAKSRGSELADRCRLHAGLRFTAEGAPEELGALVLSGYARDTEQRLAELLPIAEEVRRCRSSETLTLVDSLDMAPAVAPPAAEASKSVARLAVALESTWDPALFGPVLRRLGSACP